MIDAIEQERLGTIQRTLIAAKLSGAKTSSATSPHVAASRMMTLMMQHGGLYSLLDRDKMAQRLAAVATAAPEMLSPHTTVTSFVAGMANAAEQFFQYLVNKPYNIHSNLMSYIAFPPEGVTYTSKADEADSAKALAEESRNPAATTFIGQFIDHDLTMNAVDLFLPQGGGVIDTASPLIDLDSVYGPRSLLSGTGDLYEADGKTLRLAERTAPNGSTYFDIVRETVQTSEGPTVNRLISDMRNDENQMILQVHLLVMRVHNKLVADFPTLTLDEIRNEVILNWQSVLVNDHLPNVIEGKTLAHLIGEITKNDFGDFFYKPLENLRDKSLVVNLPHEFAIAYRFGHSQLKPHYQLNTNKIFYPLFDNLQVASADGKTTDLRGNQALPAQHVIDWHFFAGGSFKGNKIDGKVTSAVFNLPESAIPDNVKFVANLIHRNLIRSQQVGVCSGESLASAYGIPILTPDQIVPEAQYRPLFMQDGEDFQTPLWFYILMEAQTLGDGGGTKLGPLGSRFIGEVLLGAIHWQKTSYFKEVAANPKWESKVLQKLGKTGVQVKFLDLVDYSK